MYTLHWSFGFRGVGHTYLKQCMIWALRGTHVSTLQAVRVGEVGVVELSVGQAAIQEHQ